mmetsp:Transcript_32803/g.75891  ORF Transcript_32803/g.75891 Transcript_32803/m.75891 type:complete len:442 (-) Transcript_32803:657-1982(-)
MTEVPLESRDQEHDAPLAQDACVARHEARAARAGHEGAPEVEADREAVAQVALEEEDKRHGRHVLLQLRALPLHHRRPPMAERAVTPPPKRPLSRADECRGEHGDVAPQLAGGGGARATGLLPTDARQRRLAPPAETRVAAEDRTSLRALHLLGPPQKRARHAAPQQALPHQRERQRGAALRRPLGRAGGHRPQSRRRVAEPTNRRVVRAIGLHLRAVVLDRLEVLPQLLQPSVFVQPSHPFGSVFRLDLLGERPSHLGRHLAQIVIGHHRRPPAPRLAQLAIHRAARRAAHTEAGDAPPALELGARLCFERVLRLEGFLGRLLRLLQCRQICLPLGRVARHKPRPLCGRRRQVAPCSLGGLRGLFGDSLRGLLSAAHGHFRRQPLRLRRRRGRRRMPLAPGAADLASDHLLEHDREQKGGGAAVGLSLFRRLLDPLCVGL